MSDDEGKRRFPDDGFLVGSARYDVRPNDILGVDLGKPGGDETAFIRMKRTPYGDEYTVEDLHRAYAASPEIDTVMARVAEDYQRRLDEMIRRAATVTAEQAFGSSATYARARTAEDDLDERRRRRTEAYRRARSYWDARPAGGSDAVEIITDERDRRGFDARPVGRER